MSVDRESSVCTEWKWYDEWRRELGRCTPGYRKMRKEEVGMLDKAS